MINHSLIAKAIGEVKKTLRKIESSKIFLVACSGGQDSIAFLEILNFICKKNQKIHAIHINHGLREESKEEEIYVKQFCAERNIVCHVKHLNLKKPTSADIARRKRYDAFLDVAYCIGAQHIFLAHTKTDHVETILMNIIRGCGLKGLEGIKDISLRNWGGSTFHIIRPFLNISREETYNICKLLNIDFVSDCTNDNENILRVNLRKNIFPNFKGLDNSLVSLAKQAVDTNEFIANNKVNMFEIIYKGFYKVSSDIKLFSKVLIINNLREILLLEGIKIECIKYNIYSDIFDALKNGFKHEWKIKPNAVLRVVKNDKKEVFLSINFLSSSSSS